MDWDAEVDVVCTGAGLGGLASAIATVDGGGDVFVATSTRGEGAYAHAIADRPQVDHLRHWLGVDVLDSETKEYFAAVSCDLVPLSRWAGEVDVPVRVVDEPTPAERVVTQLSRSSVLDSEIGPPRCLDVALRLPLHPRVSAREHHYAQQGWRGDRSRLRSVRLSPVRLNSKARRLPTGSAHGHAIDALRYTRPVRCSGSCSRTARWWALWSPPQTGPTRFAPDTGLRWHRADHWSAPSRGTNCSPAMRPRGYAWSAGPPAGSAGLNC